MRANIFSTADNSANNAFFILYINSPSSTTRIKPILTTTSSADISALVGTFQFTTSYNSGTGAVTGLRFFMPTGNITTGTFRLYGISNS
jgi:hypothetical protein